MNVSVVIKDPFKLFVSNWLPAIEHFLLYVASDTEGIADIRGRNVLEVTLEYRDYVTKANPEEEGYSFPLFVHCRLSNVGIPSQDLYIQVRRALRDVGYLVTVHGHDDLRAVRNGLEDAISVATKFIVIGYGRTPLAQSETVEHHARSVK